MKAITSIFATLSIFATVLNISITPSQASPKATAKAESIQIILTPIPKYNPIVVATKSMGQYLVYDSNGNWFKTAVEKGQTVVYSGKNFTLLFNDNSNTCTGVGQFEHKRTVKVVGSKLVFGPKVKFTGNLKINLSSDFTREVAATKLANLSRYTLPLVLTGKANVFETQDFKNMYAKHPSI